MHARILPAGEPVTHLPVKGAILRMIWATKSVTHAEQHSIELLFRDQAACFDPDDRMLLVSVVEEWPMVGLWVNLPKADLLAPYYGFIVCLRSELPVAPTLIAGSAAVFERIFHGS